MATVVRKPLDELHKNKISSEPRSHSSTKISINNLASSTKAGSSEPATISKILSAPVQLAPPPPANNIVAQTKSTIQDNAALRLNATSAGKLTSTRNSTKIPLNTPSISIITDNGDMHGNSAQSDLTNAHQHLAKKQTMTHDDQRKNLSTDETVATEVTSTLAIGNRENNTTPLPTPSAVQVTLSDRKELANLNTPVGISYPNKQTITPATAVTDAATSVQDLPQKIKALRPESITGKTGGDYQHKTRSDENAKASLAPPTNSAESVERHEKRSETISQQRPKKSSKETAPSEKSAIDIASLPPDKLAMSNDKVTIKPTDNSNTTKVNKELGSGPKAGPFSDKSLGKNLQLDEVVPTKAPQFEKRRKTKENSAQTEEKPTKTAKFESEPATITMQHREKEITPTQKPDFNITMESGGETTTKTPKALEKLVLMTPTTLRERAEHENVISIPENAEKLAKENIQPPIKSTSKIVERGLNSEAVKLKTSPESKSSYLTSGRPIPKVVKPEHPKGIQNVETERIATPNEQISSREIKISKSGAAGDKIPATNEPQNTKKQSPVVNVVPVPTGWERRMSRTQGKPYYLNMYTKESQWEKPNGPATPSPISMETIICRHILVKHAQSRKPYSWRSASITRSREEAVDDLKRYRADILNGEQYFADVAAAYSDCSSAKEGGDVGRFQRGMMLKPFEDAAFALRVREISDIIETECGYHLIMRLE